MISPASWLAEVLIAGIPQKRSKSVVERAEQYVTLPGSAISSQFRGSATPWTSAVIETSGDGVTRKCTFVKPVQSGGSVAGEVVLCDRIIYQTHGDIQYNWQNDTKALERWTKRIEPILLAVEEIQRKKPADKSKWCRCQVNFANLNLIVQGVLTDSNVSSDSIRTQINEELHDREGGWSPGRLQQAYGRLTAYWDSYALNISNAGYEGDQLHEAYMAGTQEVWQVKCQGCKKFHAMRTKWDPKRPDLGGLRYDADACRNQDGSYNYARMLSSIRYQMPCGYEVPDDRRVREALSKTGRYLQTNPNADPTERSFTLEAVSVHYISFLSLIKEKHGALKALRYGDVDKYCAYMRERECKFWSNNDRPLMGNIVLSAALKKNRDGLPGRFARYFALDRQRGSREKGETPHWWLVIRDVMQNADSLLVFEGKLETDEEVIATLDAHDCIRRHGCADSGDDTTHVYRFCLKYGINAIKGSGSPSFSHGNEGRKVFSPEKPLWQMMNLAGPTRENPLDEPMFFLYSRIATMDRLAWLRDQAPDPRLIESNEPSDKPKWEVPADVSEDYQSHMEAWTVEDKRTPEGMVKSWVQLKDRDDLFKCESYIALLMEMAELIGL